MSFPLRLPALFVTVCLCTTAFAAEKTFFAVMNGGQVVPPSTSQAQGVAYLTYDTALKRLCFSITFSALEGPETEGHIHDGKAGTTDVVFFDLEVGSPKKACVGPFTAQQQRSLYRGHTYINIHSTAWVAGELRGQILPISTGR